MPTTRTPEPLTRETDGFTFVVLGLIARLRSLDLVAGRAPAEGPAAGPTKARGDDEVTMALLGLCSLRRSVERWIELAAHEAPRADAPHTPSASPREIAR